jgi:chemotaxis protein CheD
VNAATNPLSVAVGELRVSADAADILFTCVGSCVAVAVYDAGQKIAGLLHIVLPGHRKTPRPEDNNGFYADTGIPLLIKIMEQQGASRNRMKAIIAGGACLIANGNPDIGLSNIDKSLAMLAEAGIPVIRQEIGRAHV